MTSSSHYVRALELIGFEDLVAGGAVSAEALLQAAALDPAMLRQPDTLMPFRNFAHLLEIAAEKLNRPSLGLEYSLAGPAHAPALGPLVLFGKLATTGQEAIDLALQYWRYHTNGYAIQQLTDPLTGLAVFRFVLHADVPATRQYVELVFANIVRLCQGVTGHHDVYPSRIFFQHSRPRNVVLHEQVFRCPLEFDATHSEMHFNPDFLAHKLDGSLSLIKPIVSLFVRQRIKNLPIYDQTMTKTVALAIPSVIGAGNCNIEFVAASLGLSSKKLRRLRAAEGTSFTDILDDVRNRLARQFLQESQAPIGSIAKLLDYASTPPFILAFRRWTGETPSEFRKRMQQPPQK